MRNKLLKNFNNAMGDFLERLSPESSDNLKLVKGYLSECSKGLKMLHESGGGGLEVVALRTIYIDRLIEGLYSLAGREFCLKYPKVDQNCAIVAIGGYGRCELSPASDIDIMFLYPYKIGPYIETVVERILYILWDTGLDVGYSTRNISDCVKVSSDLVVRTSLVDSRLISGDSELYGAYEKALSGKIFSKNIRGFIEDKVREGDERRKKYGDSVYILEPDIKEGNGGLRDAHTALWAAKVKHGVSDFKALAQKGFIGWKECKEVISAYDFMLRLRNDLHFNQNHKSDRLTFALQEQIAVNMGYRDTSAGLAVEQLMRDYYLRADSIKENAEIIIDHCLSHGRRRSLTDLVPSRKLNGDFRLTKGELTISNRDLFKETPSAIMKLFEMSQLHGVKLSSLARDCLRESLDLVNEEFMSSPEVNKSFLNILRSELDVTGTLRLMHKLEVLNRFIPEFGKIKCRVQHDIYHIYTVDIHSLFTVEELRRLTLGEYEDKYPIRTTLMEDIENPEVLYLAALLHDVGKGRGGRHEEVGAEISANIARRIGLPEHDVKDIEFLVLKHLRLSHTAQRRDLHDPKLIIDFAREVGSLERLKMLYLLTYADIKAMGPDVWNEWKSTLFLELFTKAAEVFEKGIFEVEETQEKINQVCEDVRSAVGEDHPADAVSSFLASMPDRYLLSNTTKTIAEHLGVALMHEGALRLDVQHDEKRGYTRLIVTTLDAQGLFSMISGVLAANAINILGAQAYTRSGGEVFDIFHVKGGRGEIIKEGSKWQKVEKDLIDVIQGVRNVNDLVREHLKPSILGGKYRPRVKPQVVINNEISDTNTVIEIYAQDRIGLLYSITSALTMLGLYIDVSKISTMGDQATDVFYVRDIFGQKVFYKKRLEEIKKDLLRVIE